MFFLYSLDEFSTFFPKTQNNWYNLPKAQDNLKNQISLLIHQKNVNYATSCIRLQKVISFFSMIHDKFSLSVYYTAANYNFLKFFLLNLTAILQRYLQILINFSGCVTQKVRQ